MGLFDMLAGMLKVRKEQINILVIGLNNSGKSTIVNHFKDPEERSQVTLPTVGFNVEKFQSEWLKQKLQIETSLSKIRIGFLWVFSKYFDNYCISVSIVVVIFLQLNFFLLIFICLLSSLFKSRNVEIYKFLVTFSFN